MSEGPNEDVHLPFQRVQRLKKTVCGEHARGKVDLGDLSQAAAEHMAVPVAKHQGFLVVRDVRRVADQAHVVLAATTPHLMSRWTECKAKIHVFVLFSRI